MLVLTLWGWNELVGSEGLICHCCEGAGTSIELRRQRVTSSQLDEWKIWYLVSLKCVACGTYSQEVKEA